MQTDRAPTSDDTTEQLKNVGTSMREALRLKHRSLRTEQSYFTWVWKFQRFLCSKSPAELESSDVRDFMSHLAVEQKVSASTQGQAFNAILFIFRHVLNKVSRYC